MMWYLKVYVQGSKTAMATAMAYRSNFFISVFISIAGNMVAPFVTILIYGTGASIPGWLFYEALLIQSVFVMCNGVCAPIFSSLVWTTMGRIREGSYDLIMIKPGSVVFNTIAQSIDPDAIGILLGGIVMFSLSLAHLPPPSAFQWISFFFFFLMGTVVMLGCTLIMGATIFKWVGNSRIFEMYNSIAGFGRYPSSIFPKGLNILITFILPVAMLGFIPASALLGNMNFMMFLSAFPCILFLLMGIWLYKRMIYAYQSAGG